MKKKKTITYTLSFGGKQIETLTEKQRDRIAQRLSETMSIYYTAHLMNIRSLKIQTKSNA